MNVVLKYRYICQVVLVSDECEVTYKICWVLFVAHGVCSASASLPFDI